MAAYVGELAAAGVVGINLEDSLDGRLVAPGAVAAKVGEVKRHTPDVFVNARVDNFWFHEDEDLDSFLARAATYVDAGADGIFAPGLTDEATIRSVTSALAVPVNLLAVPGRSLAELGNLGVRRVSTGSLPYRAAVHAAVLAATAFREGGSPPPAPPYAELQDRLTAFRASRPQPEPQV